jgi:chromosome partitioning protein
LDLDLRQKSFGRYIENRIGLSASVPGWSLPSPDYRDLPEIDAPAPCSPAKTPLTRGCRRRWRRWRRMCDFIIIDCPGSHTRLSQVAHSLADTLITPLERQFRRFRPAGAD